MAIGSDKDVISRLSLWCGLNADSEKTENETLTYNTHATHTYYVIELFHTHITGSHTAEKDVRSRKGQPIYFSIFEAKLRYSYHKMYDRFYGKGLSFGFIGRFGGRKWITTKKVSFDGTFLGTFEDNSIAYMADIVDVRQSPQSSIFIFKIACIWVHK